MARLKNAVAKGRRNERKTADYLTDRGWQVYTVKHLRFQGDQDIFNTFDHVAYKDGVVRFIQTKSNKVDKKTKDKIGKFNFPENVYAEVFIWVDYKKKPKILTI